MGGKEGVIPTGLPEETRTGVYGLSHQAKRSIHRGVSTRKGEAKGRGSMGKPLGEWNESKGHWAIHTKEPGKKKKEKPRGKEDHL